LCLIGTPIKYRAKLQKNMRCANLFTDFEHNFALNFTFKPQKLLYERILPLCHRA
jgi:hypothetical protein